LNTSNDAVYEFAQNAYFIYLRELFTKSRKLSV